MSHYVRYNLHGEAVKVVLWDRTKAIEFTYIVFTITIVPCHFDANILTQKCTCTAVKLSPVVSMSNETPALLYNIIA